MFYLIDAVVLTFDTEINIHDTHNLQKASCSPWFSVEQTTETESVELFQYVCLVADLIKSVQINQICGYDGLIGLTDCYQSSYDL